MKKGYEVRVRITRLYDVTVEAESASEAEDMVLDMDPTKIDNESEYIDTDQEVEYVEEIDEED